jgi:2-phospho-L-lactate/phosphoenolpyruvate guanylyltransferase
MTTWAVIPVKPFNEGKSRLRGVMSDNERYQLNVRSFCNTLEVISGVNTVDRMLVISRDPEALKIAGQAGARTLTENGNRGLNQALYQANNTLDKNNDRILVLPTDLLFLTGEDVLKIIELGEKPPVVVIVADRRNKGTNALLVYPVGSIRYRFGENSSKKHMAEAQKRGIQTILTDIPGMRLDLDLVEDLEYVKSMGYSIPIRAFNPMEETVR